MDRRSFLRAAGISTIVVAAAACSPSSPQPTPSPTSSPPINPGPPDWSALRSQTSGQLVLPEDSGYSTAKQIFNPLFDGSKPAAVAQCASVEDVQACIRLIAGKAPIGARGGGHSYAGYSAVDNGLVVDLRKLSEVSVQPDGIAKVGAGAKLKDVYRALADAGRCLPAGSCPTVGIAGLTLGGGIGVLTRQYGLTCDHLVSAQVVTADGRVLTASAESEPDLYWALRGGGGGNFGLVTSFTFSTVPAPTVIVFSLKFADGTATDVFSAWQQWLGSIPDELWSNCVLSGGGTPQIRVGGCFVGPPAELTPLLNTLIKQAGSQPVSRFSQAKNYQAAMTYFAGSENKQSFVGTSRILGSPITDPSRVVALLTGRTGVDLLCDSLGGKVSAIEPEATAFWHRKALASIQIYTDATAENKAAKGASIAEVAAGLAELGAGGGYVNYIDPALPDWANAYYGGNLPRLRKIAATYDPNKVFGFAQSI